VSGKRLRTWGEIPGYKRRDGGYISGDGRGTRKRVWVHCTEETREVKGWTLMVGVNGSERTGRCIVTSSFKT
jgi:hypothetical protein